MDTFNKIEIAQGFIDSGKYQKAIDYLTDYISNNDSESLAYIHRGYALFCIAEIDKAIADLTHAIAINEKADLAYWYLSQIYVQKTDNIKAKEYIIKAIEIDKENLFYIGDYAIIEQNLKNYKRSIDLCNQILSSFPADTFALNARGYSYLCQNDFKNAIADFERVLIENPHDCFTLNNLGFALSKNGAHKKAYKYLQLAIQIEPTFSYPHDNLGYLFYLDHDYAQALKNINKSIDLDPSNSWAFKNRALVYIALGDNDKATTDLYRAKELGYAEEYDNEVNELIEKTKNIGNIPC